MENTTTAVQQPTNWLKVGLAWAMSLLFIFILIYVISKAWKRGQTAA